MPEKPSWVITEITTHHTMPSAAAIAIPASAWRRLLDNGCFPPHWLARHSPNTAASPATIATALVRNGTVGQASLANSVQNGHLANAALLERGCGHG